MNVTLTQGELWAGSQVGLMRAHQANILGLSERLAPTSWVENLSVHINGALGELAVAKALRTYYDFHFNQWKEAPDLSINGIRIEVRYRSKETYQLLVRKDDDKNSVYFLVVGNPPNLNIVGWIYGKKAMKPEFIANHGGLGEAYFVPNNQLHSVEEFIKLSQNPLIYGAITE